MKYYGLIQNDLINKNSLSVSLLVQGCPENLKKYYNEIYQDYENGQNVPDDIRGQIVKAISRNDLIRDLNILGGEPFFNKNKQLVLSIVSAIRVAYPNIKITIWTKYSFEELVNSNDNEINGILKKINYLIDVNDEMIPLDELKIL